ncbi:MAG: glycosyltransferase family 2 protein [Candidatus Omnitrophota bacterium]
MDESEKMKERPQISNVELTVVIPCLNEEDTVGTCVKKAIGSFLKLKITGEVIVVDNGSVDNSIRIAESEGARVIYKQEKGYGSAIKEGIKEAKGKYIIMGDADDTYDFSEIEPFVTRFRQGTDLVMGSRFKGKMFPGAMHWSHRYIGNPVLTAILNLFFRARVSDAHCGLRGFGKAAIERLELKTRGMEFASEMLIKSAQAGLKIEEVPIDYRPSIKGRRPHLHPFRDGWRHLRFMLLFCPDYLFLLPGLVLFILGFSIFFISMFKIIVIFHIPLGISGMIGASALMFVGMQIILFGASAKLAAFYSRFTKEDSLVKFIIKYFTLEKGILLGSVIFAIGLLISLSTLYFLSRLPAYGPINVRLTRLAIGGITFIILGIQLFFSSFYLSLFDIESTLE